ncbi:MAG: hypothetical protein LUD29_06825 [Clostridia bacterium]|nr:hypothetical protein [Clostridia bacterium]
MVATLKVYKSVEGDGGADWGKEYCNFMPSYHGEVIFVGISSDAKTKGRTCL